MKMKKIGIIGRNGFSFKHGVSVLRRAAAPGPRSIAG